MTQIQRVAAVDGLELHVVVEGPDDAETVVLVHGWPDTHVVWRHQVGPLVDAGYRVITYDQRGFGASGVPAAVDGFHVFKAMVDVGTVLDALAVDRAHLVGHDWGAAPVWLTATFAPGRVRTMTAVSVGHPLAFRQAGIEQQQRSFYMLLFQFEDIAEQWLMADDWANFRTLLGNPPDVDDRVAELSRPGALTASLNWYRANVHPRSLVDPPPDLPSITVPAMGVMGAGDWALLPEQMEGSEAYVQSTWRYEVIEGAEHWVQTEQPEAFNAVLLDWLAG